MAKLSLITVIWVWHCAVYGQLPVNNFGPYHSYYAPYPSMFVVQQPNDGISSQSGGTGELGNPLKTFSFQDTMTYKMSQLEAKIADLTLQLKAINVNLAKKADQTALETTNTNLAKKADQTALETTNTNLAKKADQTALETTNTNLAKKADQTALDLTNIYVTDLKVSTSPNLIGKIPTSCADLKTIGFVKSGIYSILDSKQVKNVYCDFTKTIDAELQKMIGTVNVKSTPVNFHAQLSQSYSASQTTIPFDSIKINLGTALNPSTGIFVAPTPGKYFFAYTGISDSGAIARVQLQKAQTGTTNWILVGEGYGDTTFKTFSMHVTLDLVKGDQVRLYLSEGKIHESSLHKYLNYVGWLMEENELTV